jgi:chromosome segregation ATPase
MSNELPEKPNALQKLMARFRNAAKGFRGGYADEISSLRGEVDSYKQGEQEVREMRQEAEARADKLSKWEIEIREKAYNVAGRERANEERAEELSNYSNALNKRAQEIEIEATKRAHILLDEYKKDLSNREEALSKGEEALSDKEDAVEEALRKRKEALSAKEDAAEEALRQRKEALRKREEALSDKEARVGGLERLLKDDRILPENEAPKETATRLAFISRMQDLQGQLDVLDSICSELNGVPDKEEAEDIDRNRYNILGRFLALITMDEITKRTK